MILVGNRRGGAANLARHLMNMVENDHVHIHEVRGFVADDLDGAYHEAFGISRGIRKGIEAEAFHCDARDRAETQALIESQLQERRTLQGELEQVQQETDAVSRLLKTDPAQKLIIPPDPEALTIKAKVERDPAYILGVITDKKENFSRPDIVRALAEYIEAPLSLGNAVDSVMRSAKLVEIQDSPFHCSMI